MFSTSHYHFFFFLSREDGLITKEIDIGIESGGPEILEERSISYC